MRKILLSLFALGLAVTASAQNKNFYYINGTTIDDAGLAPASFTSTIRFQKNQAGDPVTFMWRVLGVDTINTTGGSGTASFGVCDNVTCISQFMGNDFTMDLVPANAPYGSFKLQGFAATGDVKVVVRVRVWDQDNPGMADTIDISWRTDNWVSIDEYEAEPKLSVYPNPATDVLNVSYDLVSGTNGSFELVNLVGSAVFTKTLPVKRGDFTLDIERLPKGIYFYVIKNSDGKALTTKKLVVR